MSTSRMMSISPLSNMWTLRRAVSSLWLSYRRNSKIRSCPAAVWGGSSITGMPLKARRNQLSTRS